MEAVIVSSSYSYLERIELLVEAYKSKGYNTTVVLTDFVHSEKSVVTDEKDNFVFVKTKPYYKNISVQRLYSHYRFAKDAFSKIRQMKVDLLHVLLPANSLAKEANKYKKQNPDVELYFDLIDLWPETMPINRFKNALPFQWWKQLRDKNLGLAKKIFCECDLYKEILGVCHDKRYETLYWVKNAKETHSVPKLEMDHIHLCYLGAINNIIDMDLIVEICQGIAQYYPVTLHIIGKGERKEEFLEKLRTNQVDICDYGVIYDDVKKQQIFDKCHFGLNIMKPSVCVGLTMKSLDYFRGQLPIINSIKGDTTTLVEKYKIGYNCYQDYLMVIQQLTLEDYLQMRQYVSEMYREKFTREAFLERFNNIYE